MPLLLILTIYALVRSIADLRAGRKAWGAIGLLLVVAVAAAMFIPLETHAVKIDLPRS